MTAATDSAPGTPLLGRADELERVAAAIRDAESGAGHIVLLCGEAGVGKSRLVREIASLARSSGTRAAIAATYEDTDGRPFGPILDLLRGLQRSTPPAARDAALAANAALSQAVNPEQSSSRWAQIDAVVEALSMAADADPPLRLVVIEDLHWADASTLELLVQVTRRLDALPIVAVFTFRPPSHDAQALIAFTDSVRQLFGSERIDLGPVGGVDAAALVRAAAGGTLDEAGVAAIVQRGDGNPLFLEEAARDASRAARAGSAAPSVPAAIREIVQRRVATLPAHARDLVELLAVLGETSDVSRIASLLEQKPEAIASALDVLVGEGIMAPQTEGGFAFRHALTRDAVYESIPLAHRRQLHERCAAFIEATEGDRNAAAIARHLEQVGGPEQERRAAALRAVAGEQSLAQAAYEQAADYFTMAIELMERVGEPATARRRAQLRLAEAKRLTRADDSALEAFASVAEDAAADGDVDAEAIAAVGYEHTFVVTGRPRGGANALSLVLLDRALAHQEARGDLDRLGAGTLAASAQARFFAGRREEALAFAMRAVDVARATNDAAAEAAALDTRRRAIWGPDNVDECLALTRAVVDRATAAGDADLQLEGLYWQVAVLLERGARAEAESAIDRFGYIAERIRQPLRLSELRRMRAMLAHLSGDLPSAHAYADAALRFAIDAGNAEARLYYTAQMAVIAADAERRAVVAEFGVTVAPWATSPDYTRLLPLLAYLSLRTSDREGAARLLAVLGANGIERIERDAMWLPMLSLLAEVASQLGEPVAAQQVLEMLAPYADRYVVNSNAVCYGSVERLLGKLADVIGAPDADQHRQRGLERNEAIGAKVWLEAPAASTRVTRTFMFTDIVKSTNLAEAMGDDAWELLLRWHNQALEAQFLAFGGEEVVSTGDGFFVAFDTADAAIDCAIAVQQALAEHRRTTGFAPQVRIGVHSAEATAVDRNYHGVGVHEAARISALAEGGEIIASTSTAGSRPTLGVSRTVTLKGIAEPVEVATVAWR